VDARKGAEDSASSSKMQMMTSFRLSVSEQHCSVFIYMLFLFTVIIEQVWSIWVGTLHGVIKQLNQVCMSPCSKVMAYNCLQFLNARLINM